MLMTARPERARGGILATHLADTSVLIRLHQDDVAVRAESMFISGRIATCAIVDLELLHYARAAGEHEQIRLERQFLPRTPITEAGMERAVDVQGLLAAHGQHRDIPIRDLMIAATAEQSGLVLLHYHQAFDIIAAITRQPTEWVVPPGSVP